MNRRRHDKASRLATVRAQDVPEWDVIIVGAGVVGSMVAHALSRYALDVLLLDRASDVGEGTTKANTAIVHAGYDTVPGTLKARLNLAGNAMFPQVCRDLDVDYDRFVACNVWQKRYSRENREAIGDVHEYLLVYAMDKERFKQTRNRISPTDEQSKIYKNATDDPKGRWRGIPMTAQGWRPNQMYEITSPAGIVHRPPEGRCWSMIEPEFKKLLKDGRIYFGKDGKAQPSVIRYLSEVEGFVPWTWWPHEEVGHTDEAKKEIQGLFQTQTAFDTPKPTRLIERILQIATNPGDLVLDSFAGSGTTGHAVLKLNEAAPDAPPRRFALVEMEPDLARNVTAERVRRVAEGYTRPKGAAAPGLGGGFRFCELGGELFDEFGQIRESVTFGELARHVWFTEFHEPLPRERVPNSPFLGECNGVGLYLLFNGILGDKTVNGGNVLTRAVYERLPTYDGPKIIYCAGDRIGTERARAESIVVRQTPYEIKTR